MNGSLARISCLPGEGFFGIATTKKIGDRPARNRAKRRFREAVRLTPELRHEKLDYVLIVLAAASDVAFPRIQEEVRVLLARANERWESELASS